MSTDTAESNSVVGLGNGHDTPESNSAVCMTPQHHAPRCAWHPSMTPQHHAPRCAWHPGITLHGVHDTPASRSTVCMTQWNQYAHRVVGTGNVACLWLLLKGQSVELLSSVYNVHSAAIMDEEILSLKLTVYSDGLSRIILTPTRSCWEKHAYNFIILVKKRSPPPTAKNSRSGWREITHYSRVGQYVKFTIFLRFHN